MPWPDDLPEGYDWLRKEAEGLQGFNWAWCEKQLGVFDSLLLIPDDAGALAGIEGRRGGRHQAIVHLTPGEDLNTLLHRLVEDDKARTERERQLAIEHDQEE